MDNRDSDDLILDPRFFNSLLMLTAAIDFWLLPATLFFDAFSPPSKPSIAEVVPFAPIAQRIRRKRKVIRSKRGD